ncbi:MAG: 16S rRNA (cytosine(1402)-N(4))-methyltransferase RsmH [Bacilli bacterium]|nr:16S rRNA (cytosine(1402)-N(4))-methyltransferase RsmH [Bacilli bacterium]
MDSSEPKHQRRVRYKGTHPKTFRAKYKELQPERYKETIDKIIKKGNTPAGMHRSICVDEIMNFLDIKSGQIGFDATLGYGGHSQEMLKRLNNNGHLYAVDKDPIEMRKTQERLNNLGYDSRILTVENIDFSDIDIVCAVSGKFNFVLADLGVSSMQIDNPERGFSYKIDGPLDLRMNPKQGIPAYQRLRSMNSEEIEGMLIENADEPYAREIAEEITQHYQNGNEITTTTQLRNIIEKALDFIPKSTKSDDIKKSCQRTFQAIRIDINHEFHSLFDFLEKLPEVLAENGKVAILSFHSGEDRLVKKAFKQGYKEGIYKVISPEPIRPSMEEQSSNSRARSAKLRWAIRN